MAKTQFNVDQFKTEAVKPLYAVAGATELAYELARGYALEAQKTATERFSDVQDRVSKIEREPKALQNQAVSLVNARVDELTKDAKDAQNKFEARIAELQKDAKAFPAKFQGQFDEALAELTKTYESLADRGEKLVAAIRKDGVKAVTVVRNASKKSSVVRRQAAKKGAARTAPASAAAAEKAPGNGAKPAAKKAGATTTKKTAAKKATSSSTTTATTSASA